MNFDKESDLFDYLEKHSYAAVYSDIMDEMGFRTQVVSPNARIKPIKDNYVAMGRAVTLLNSPDGNENNPYDLVIKCIDSMSSETILVTTGTEPLETGIMGELTATALRVNGCRGAVVNGYTRDARKIMEMNFPTFAWGTSPIDTTGRVRVIETNIPITIGGVSIHPGNMVFADLDGIIVIPKEIESEVIKKVIERIGTENTVRNELADGKKMADVWKRHGVL
jgi:4-hydroxy-4-methyl-2-oxoglutarate aldolase